MTNTLQFVSQVAFQNGTFAAGAKATFYKTGTTTPATVYSDADYATPHASPVVADGAGVFPAVYYNGSTELKVVLTAADDTAIDTIDPVMKISTTGSAAAAVTFSPITGNAASDVQSAIENNTTARENRTADVRAFLGSADKAEMRTNTGLGSVAVAALIDDDTFATATATNVPSAESVKAYVDALGRLGVAQTWQDVSGSRAAGTSYRNETGGAIEVAGTASSGAAKTFQVSSDDSTWVTVHEQSAAVTLMNFSATIPEDWYYRVSSGATITNWVELR